MIDMRPQWQNLAAALRQEKENRARHPRLPNREKFSIYAVKHQLSHQRALPGYQVTRLKAAWPAHARLVRRKRRRDTKGPAA